MKIQKILFVIVLAFFTLVSCIQEVQKEKISLAISGMTCEIGCAKTIQSKLTKKEGVLNAKVIFTDSIATIEFDNNKVSKKDLISFVNGIAGGDLYKATETIIEAHTCSNTCKTTCEIMTSKMECKVGCEMACCSNKKV